MISTPGELYIQKRIGLAAFQRAQEVHRLGSIHETRLRGGTLQALCRGSAPEPYRVEATLDERRVLGASCSCPVGGAGRCKHVGALLLAWRDRPWLFRGEGDPARALRQRDRAELERMVIEVLRRHPELEWLVEAPAEVAGTRLESSTFRDQASRAIAAGGAEARRRLGALRALGERFLVEREVKHAVMVFEGLLEALIEASPGDEAEADSFEGLVLSCLHGLGRCLAVETRDERAREAAIKAVYFAFRRGLDGGGLAVADEAAELLQARSQGAERELLIRWLSALVESTGDAVTRREAGGLWLGLLGRASPRYLDAARASGRADDAVDWLLAAGRGPEAQAEARQAREVDLLGVVRVFERRGKAREAFLVLTQRGESEEHSPEVLDWLARYFEEKKPAKSLDLGLVAFRNAPSLARYLHLERVATRLGQWDALGQSLQLWLGEHGDAGLVAAVALRSGNLSAAVEAVRGPGITVGTLLAVARGCESARPADAAVLYRRAIEGLIDARGREHYRAACRYLRRLRALFEEIGEGARWVPYLSALRERHRGLRGLAAELESARLLAPTPKETLPSAPPKAGLG